MNSDDLVHIAKHMCLWDTTGFFKKLVTNICKETFGQTSCTCANVSVVSTSPCVSIQLTLDQNYLFDKYWWFHLAWNKDELCNLSAFMVLLLIYRHFTRQNCTHFVLFIARSMATGKECGVLSCISLGIFLEFICRYSSIGVINSLSGSGTTPSLSWTCRSLVCKIIGIICLTFFARFIVITN